MDLNEKYGLPKRVILQEEGSTVYIVKNIKSRIIMKQAQQILDTAQQITEKNNDINVALKCNDNICSKSITFLEENGITIEYL